MAMGRRTKVLLDLLRAIASSTENVPFRIGAGNDAQGIPEDFDLAGAAFALELFTTSRITPV